MQAYKAKGRGHEVEASFDFSGLDTGRFLEHLSSCPWLAEQYFSGIHPTNIMSLQQVPDSG